MNGWVAVGVWLATMLGVVALCYSHERHQWNGGRCGCGRKWESFDMDSQGNMGYKCRGKKDCTIWLWFNFARG